MAIVKDILESKGADVIVASSDTTVHEAAVMMSETNVGSIAIVDNHKLNGIFTERDIMRRVVVPELVPSDTPLSAVMTTSVKTITMDTTVVECYQIMTDMHIRHLMVQEGEALIGLVSLRDVLKFQIKEKL